MSPMTGTRKTRLAMQAALAVAALTVLAPSTASAQGYGHAPGVVIMMPDIFGVFRQPQPHAYGLVEPMERQARPQRRVRTQIKSTRNIDVDALAASSDRANPTHCTPNCPTSVMNDPTLRAGDMVMTDEGLMVFRGGSAPHRARDFRPASETKLSARDRQFVAAIERTPGQNAQALAPGGELKVAEVAAKGE